MDAMEDTHLLGVFVFFLTLNTIVVSLRLYIRLWLKKSAFGWDDVFLIITYIGLVLFVTAALMAMQNGVTNYHILPRSEGEAARWTAIMSVICYVISGTVKLSVALVIYRLLDYRPVLKAMIIADISVCFMWTLVSTLLLSLGCTGTYISPYRISPTVCRSTFYAQEASYIFFDVFHVVFPISLLWNVQIKGGQKTSVILLFGFGMVSTIAAVLKLAVIVDVFRVPATGKYQDLWQRAVIWSVAEHGLSLFAATILALRPICHPITKGWSSLSDTVSQLYTSSRRDSWVSRPNSDGTAPTRKYSWATAWAAATPGSSSHTRSSTSITVKGTGTPRAYLTRVSDNEHRLMPYRASDPTGGAGKQWNWTNQWPTNDFRAPPAASAATSPALLAPPILWGGPDGGSAVTATLLRSASYESPPSPGSEQPMSAASNIPPGGAGGRATQRNTPDYFTCVVEANEQDMTVQEYLRSLGVSSRLTEQESIESMESMPRPSRSGAGPKNWFEGRRLSDTLL